MRKELESNMRFKNQSSQKRLTSKKNDRFNTKPSFIAILLIVIALMQLPISLKASLRLICVFSEPEAANKALFFCND